MAVAMEGAATVAVVTATAAAAMDEALMEEVATAAVQMAAAKQVGGAMAVEGKAVVRREMAMWAAAPTAASVVETAAEARTAPSRPQKAGCGLYMCRSLSTSP